MKRALFLQTLTLAVVIFGGVFAGPTIGQDSASAQPRVITAVAPLFPFELTLINHNSASVQIEVRINPAGEVIDANTVSRARLEVEHDVDKPLHAARLWRFSSVSKDSPRRVAVIVFNFQLVAKDGSEEDLMPIFKPPYEIDVRSRPYRPMSDYDFPMTVCPFGARDLAERGPSQPK